MKLRSAALKAPVLAAAVALSLGATPPEPAPPSPVPFTLGAQTHFSQNWPPVLLDRAKSIGVPALRDGVPWGSAERRAGVYDFSAPTIRPLVAFCRSGGDLLLTIVPENALYDGGGLVHSAQGVAAYARYITALADLFPGCLTAIEVGNEINAVHGLGYPAGTDKARAYVDLVRQTARAVHEHHPGVRILGGSTNVIGTGFLDGLFGAGLLGVADGVAVHPYRTHAENVDVEIEHLRATMRHHGREIPIWATEFSDNYPDAATPAGELVKMATLLSASGVKRAYWYALVDQKFFKNMGLFDSALATKPAGYGYYALQRLLLPLGRPVRVDAGDPNVRLYRYGSDAYVVWGASGTIHFTGPARLRDARGGPLAAGDVPIGLVPVIATGATGFTLQPGPVLADSLFGYGSAPWSYHARTPDGTLHDLDWLDGPWTSSHSNRFYNPLWLGDTSGATAGDASHAIRPVLRYTAPAAITATISACLAKARSGDGVDVTIQHNGKTLAAGLLTERLDLKASSVALAKGDTIDLSAGPNRVPGGDAFGYRMQIVGPGNAQGVQCP